MARKTASQLDREIAAILAKPLARQLASLAGREYRSTMSSDVGFSELVRDTDPAAMQVAEDVLLDRGRKMREATGGMQARNFTIELNPMWGPNDKWKMVQTNVVAFGDKSGKVWIKWSVANGPDRVQREREYKIDVDDARKMAVATAWAIAKAVKSLPMDVGEKKLKTIVDKAIARGKKNVVPEELF